MPKQYRQLDNGQGDASKPGPISSYTVREYPTKEQIGKAKTDKLRRKPIKTPSFVKKLTFSTTNKEEEVGWKQDRIKQPTRKIKLKFLPDVPYTPYKTYKGAGSKAAAKKKK